MSRLLLTILFVCLHTLWIHATDKLGIDCMSDSVAADTLPTLSDKSLKPKGLWSVQLAGSLGQLAHSNKDVKLILHSYGVSFYDLRMKWQAAASADANAYDRALRYPHVQFGLMYADMNRLDIYQPTTPYHSRIGHIWTVYGGIQWDAWRHGRWSVGIDLQNGIGYCPNPYNTQTNDDQWIIGSHLTIYVNLGAYVRYQIAPRWNISAAFDFKHYSNGTLDRPNLGANSLGPTLAVEYSLSKPSADPKPLRARDEQEEGLSGEALPSFYLDFTAGLGMRALIDRFNVYHTSHHPIFGFPMVMVAPMWRWHLLHATGFALDYSYLDYVYRIHDYDIMREHTPRHGYSPHVLGLSLRHEIFYKQMSLNVGLGWNIHKHLGYTSEQEESWLYQHVGLRYSFPFTHNRLYLGFQIKAHRFGKVDCVQLVSGWRLGL